MTEAAPEIEPELAIVESRFVRPDRVLLCRRGAVIHAFEVRDNFVQKPHELGDIAGYDAIAVSPGARTLAMQVMCCLYSMGRL